MYVPFKAYLMLLQIYKPDSAAPTNFCLIELKNWVNTSLKTIQ